MTNQLDLFAPHSDDSPPSRDDNDTPSAPDDPAPSEASPPPSEDPKLAPRVYSLRHSASSSSHAPPKRHTPEEATARLGLDAALNPAQLAACTHTDAPLLILAGAGSGKTRVITFRIAYLILTQGFYPDQILAVTFTNKAAGEMRERVTELLDELGIHARYPPHIGTFHATCVRILRRHAVVLGLQSGFSIYDSDDSRAVVRDCARRINLPDDRKSLRGYQSYIERCKNRGDTPSIARSCAVGLREERRAELYALYDVALREANAVDFSDLIFLTNRLFDAHPDLRARYARRWRHVLVDEFQDTNAAQYRLLRHLVDDHGLTVVGDDDQSIYAWRGADVQHMLAFERDFPGARVVKLEQNYRSTQPILDLASDLIAHNLERRPKRLWTAQTTGAPVKLYTALDERDEARYIARCIRTYTRQGTDLEEIGVLFRTNAQARVLEECLRVADVPYRLVGDVSFYARAEIKDLIAYMKLLVNPLDRIALRRAINTPPRGIGAKTLERLEALAATQTDGDIQAALATLTPDADVGGLRRRAREALIGFRDLLAGWREQLPETPPGDILRRVITDTDYLEHLEQKDPERAEQTQNNVHELLGAILEFERQQEDPTLITLQTFLEQAALNTSDEAPSEHHRVSLMTIHSAKGLEFDVVFVAGLDEDLLPYRRRDEVPHFEEERRLAYVAFTRARHHLVLCHAQRRRLHGNDRQGRPSRFLSEVDALALEHTTSPHASGGGRPRPSPNPSSTAPWSSSSSSGASVRRRDQGSSGRGSPTHTSLPSSRRQRSSGAFEPGDIVTHERFGVGEVKEVINRGDKTMVVVDFPMAGTKKIISRFIQKL